MKQQVRIIHKQQLRIIIHLFLVMRIQGENFQFLYIFVGINPIKKMYEIIKKNFETRSGSDNRNKDAHSEHSDEEYHQHKAEIEKKKRYL